MIKNKISKIEVEEKEEEKQKMIRKKRRSKRDDTFIYTRKLN